MTKLYSISFIYNTNVTENYLSVTLFPRNTLSSKDLLQEFYKYEYLSKLLFAPCNKSSQEGGSGGVHGSDPRSVRFLRKFVIFTRL